MRVAVFGDIHGHWIAFRDAILALQAESPFDLVLQVGDAQPIRDEQDLAYLPVPERYRSLGDYALLDGPWPVPTLFIGGNHEPFNVLEAMTEGGFLQPNQEYLGRAGCRTFGDLRIAGLGGVLSPRAIDRPRLPWPFPPQQAREASYYRRADLAKVAAFGKVDILLLHEWPTQMAKARSSDWPRHWENVGSEPLGELVDKLRPSFVFCGHMHHAAKVQTGSTTIVALDVLRAGSNSAVAILETEPLGLAWPW
jgi:hypothetical protein